VTERFKASGGELSRYGTGAVGNEQVHLDRWLVLFVTCDDLRHRAWPLRARCTIDQPVAGMIPNGRIGSSAALAQADGPGQARGVEGIPTGPLRATVRRARRIDPYCFPR
jgi:hypothetical protein